MNALADSITGLTPLHYIHMSLNVLKTPQATKISFRGSRQKNYLPWKYELQWYLFYVNEITRRILMKFAKGN